MDNRLQPAIDEVAAMNESHGVVMRGGKRYVQVVHRVEALRRAFGTDVAIETQLLENDGKRVLCRAEVKLDGKVIGTGHAEERHGEGPIKQKVEVAETSAIGRALAACGLSGGEFASANEMDRVPVTVTEKPAPERDPPPKKTRKKKTAEKVLPAQPEAGLYQQIKDGIFAVKGDKGRLGDCLAMLPEKQQSGALNYEQYAELYILALIEANDITTADQALGGEKGQRLDNDTRLALSEMLEDKRTTQ